MQRPFLFIPRLSWLLCASIVLLPISVSAQSIKITLPDATTCTYATGQVTNNATPGQLQATATATPTGTGCTGSPSGAAPVTFGPASPLTPALQTLAGNTGTVNFGFTALNANQCIGSIIGRNGVTGGAFTGSTTLCSGSGCNSPVSAPASFTNASTTTNAVYDVAVVCSGAGSPATSTATITVPFTIPPPLTGCPSPPVITSTTTGITNFTQLTGNLSVNYFGGGFKTVDVASFDSIYGMAWPGGYNSIADFSLPKNKYIAAAFKVPANYMTAANVPASLYGEYFIGESGFSAPVSMTISTSCGDFSNPATQSGSTVVAGCYLNKGIADAYIAWTKSGGCALTGGTSYYLNIIQADVSTVTAGGGGTAKSSTNANNCSSSSCSVPIQNGPGTWSAYTPQ